MAGTKNTIRAEGRILLFPGVQLERRGSTSGESAVALSKHSDQGLDLHALRRKQIQVVLCGTLRMDPEGLARAFYQLNEFGCRILSTGNVETDALICTCDEEMKTAERLKLKHLEAIQRARFVWLHAPRGYVGPTAALELGFAFARGVPIFSSERPEDIVLQKLVRVVTSPQEVVLDILHDQLDRPVRRRRALGQSQRRAALGQVACALWNRIFAKLRE